MSNCTCHGCAFGLGKCARDDDEPTCACGETFLAAKGQTRCVDCLDKLAPSVVRDALAAKSAEIARLEELVGKMHIGRVHVDAELAGLRDENERLWETLRRLRRNDEPYSTRSILQHLASTADKLLDHLLWDGHGHEVVMEARDAARRLLSHPELFADEESDSV